MAPAAAVIETRHMCAVWSRNCGSSAAVSGLATTAHHLRNHVGTVGVRLLLHFAKNEQQVGVGVIQMVTRSKGQQVDESGRQWALKLNSPE